MRCGSALHRFDCVSDFKGGERIGLIAGSIRAPYANQRWTTEDDNLLHLMREGRKSLTLITAKLKCPMNAIRARAGDLHINIPGTGIAMSVGKKDNRQVGLKKPRQNAGLFF